MSAVETLREAAKVLRERAGAATPGPWDFQPWSTYALPSGDRAESILLANEACDGEIARELPDDDGHYIATMHPGVALALADWLDDLASGWPWDDDGTCVWDDGTPMRLEESADTHALAVAEAILGSAR